MAAAERQRKQQNWLATRQFKDSKIIRMTDRGGDRRATKSICIQLAFLLLFHQVIMCHGSDPRSTQHRQEHDNKGPPGCSSTTHMRYRQGALCFGCRTVQKPELAQSLSKARTRCSVVVDAIRHSLGSLLWSPIHTDPA